LEERVAAQLEAAGVAATYESVASRIQYEVHELRTYTPDFVLPNGIIIETKGLFTVEDRKKHTLIKTQHPEKDIRFVFSNSNSKLRKGSPTSYAAWCEKQGFLYADKLIPQSWIKEPRKS
jgi:hypothetical protein